MSLILQWQEHLHDRVPELSLYEIAAQSDDRGPLTAEVRLLRSQGVSWERIATAVGITRQSAHRRWRHVETELATIGLHGPTADLARLRGALAHLGAVVNVHDARPEIQILHDLVDAGELVTAALARTPQDDWMVTDDLHSAAIQLENALRLARRQAARAFSNDTATVDPDQVLAEGGRIELVQEEEERASEEGPAYFVLARAYDAADTHIAAGAGDTVSSALATLTPQGALAAVPSDDLSF